MIVQVATLPVSGLNVGLSYAPIGLSARISRLALDVAKFTAAIDTQASVTAEFPPNLPTLALAFGGMLDAAEYASMFSPNNWVTANAEANVSISADGVEVTALIETIGQPAADLEAGLAAPGITGWSYSGATQGFGGGLTEATELGFGEVRPDDEINAIIIATNAPDSWASFSEGFETGRSASQDTDTDHFEIIGTLGGGQWNFGARVALAILAQLLAELQGAEASIETQVDLTLGVGLPSPDLLLDIAANIDLDAALDNLVSVQADVLGALSGLNARIDVAAALSAEIEAQLSAGGLTLWRYTGRAGSLGAEFAAEISGGLPGADDGPDGPCKGLVLATKDGAAWASFGLIFNTG